MRSANDDPTRTPVPDDVLSLFEPEQELSSSTEEQLSPAGSFGEPRTDSATHASESMASLTPVHETGAPGTISLDRLVETVAPLRFVDGVALVQALATALKSKAGINAGMPDERGVFLNEAGEFTILAAKPTGEPAARELARLLHRLVPSESTPPVGRLFVDRWSTGQATDLSEFSTELAYFARPNGRDLLRAVHARSAGRELTPATSASHGQAPVPIPPPQRPVFEPPVQAVQPEPPRLRETPHVSWLQSHRRHMFAAAVLVAAAIIGTGLVTWFSPSPAAQAAEPTELAAAETDAVVAEGETAASAAVAEASGRGGAALPSVRGSRPAAAGLTGRATGSPRGGAPGSARGTAGGPSGVGALSGAPNAALSAALPSRSLPDLRIYSASDSDIQPPKLLSTEIVEGLIDGFDTRTNQVEVIVSQSGDVERVRMLGPPQRIPDVMLLSRVKEWVFDPATKDGAAVRYRLVLSWNVTP